MCLVQTRSIDSTLFYFTSKYSKITSRNLWQAISSDLVLLSWSDVTSALCVCDIGHSPHWCRHYIFSGRLRHRPVAPVVFFSIIWSTVCVRLYFYISFPSTYCVTNFSPFSFSVLFTIFSFVHLVPCDTFMMDLQHLSFRRNVIEWESKTLSSSARTRSKRATSKIGYFHRIEIESIVWLTFSQRVTGTRDNLVLFNRFPKWKSTLTRQHRPGQ